MGKLEVGVILYGKRRFFDSLANVLHSTFSNKNSTLSLNVQVELPTKFHDCFGMSNWVLNYWIVRSLVNVAVFPF